ncbi:hypothetical protein COR50_03100 [Chitinophaga caeni]|uniref:Uncharacterized protein n=1 Tax=Chitinophaga caeni TaxID=2029983 RepID=A0A291QQM5_9BACT|nr:hypothetical protein COR50_03100 [Chitinophaga caeni]
MIGVNKKIPACTSRDYTYLVYYQLYINGSDTVWVWAEAYLSQPGILIPVMYFITNPVQCIYVLLKLHRLNKKARSCERALYFIEFT